MISSRKILSLAVLVGGSSILLPATAEAKVRPATSNHLHSLVNSRQFTGLSPDLGFGQIPLPLPRGQVRRFKELQRENPKPPPIPRVLRHQPLAPRVAAEAAYRRAFALELYREEALHRASHIAGGIFFTPPFGTPYFPVRRLNAFNYLPVFRIL